MPDAREIPNATSTASILRDIVFCIVVGYLLSMADEVGIPVQPVQSIILGILWFTLMVVIVMMCLGILLREELSIRREPQSQSAPQPGEASSRFGDNERLEDLRKARMARKRRVEEAKASRSKLMAERERHELKRTISKPMAVETSLPGFSYPSPPPPPRALQGPETKQLSARDHRLAALPRLEIGGTLAPPPWHVDSTVKQGRYNLGQLWV